MGDFWRHFVLAAAPGLSLLVGVLVWRLVTARHEPPPMTPQEQEEMLRLLTRRPLKEPWP